MKLFSRLGAALISILLVALALEAVIRLSGVWQDRQFMTRHQFQKSSIPGVSYTYKANFTDQWSGFLTKTNSLGLVDPWEPEQMKPECERILFVGSSFTLGFGVDWDLAYPRELERRLNQSARQNSKEKCYQVINGAQDAYNAKDTLALMTFLIEKYQPQRVFFDVNRFAYDDSMSVDAEGRISVGETHSSIHDWLQTQWGLTGPTLPMNRPAPEPEQSLLIALLRQSKAFLYFEPRLIALGNKLPWPQSYLENDSHLPSVILQATFKGLHNKPDRFPRFSAIQFSPFYKNRVWQALGQAQEIAKKKNISLTFLALDFVMPAEFKPVVYLQEMNNMSSLEFLRKYNLVWDFHPNQDGHRLLAQGLLEMILENKERPQTDFNILEYQTEYNKWAEQFIDTFSAEIRLSERVNVHQIVGGLRDDRFMNEFFSLYSFLLKASQPQKLMIKGDNYLSIPQTLKIQISDGTTQLEFTRQALSGPFSIEIGDLSQLQGMIDVQLECVKKPCQPIQLDYVGFN